MNEIKFFYESAHGHRASYATAKAAENAARHFAESRKSKVELYAKFGGVAEHIADVWPSGHTDLTWVGAQYL